MKKLKVYLTLLLIILGLCVMDFSLLGVPWDDEIPVRKPYPDIAIDMTRTPSVDLISCKLSKKRLTHIDKENYFNE